MADGRCHTGVSSVRSTPRVGVRPVGEARIVRLDEDHALGRDGASTSAGSLTQEATTIPSARCSTNAVSARCSRSGSCRPVMMKTAKPWAAAASSNPAATLAWTGSARSSSRSPRMWVRFARRLRAAAFGT